MKTSIIDISNDKKHKLRYSHCLGLMINELWLLNNPEVKNILDKYSCGVFQQMGILDATLRFPISLKESDLPKILQKVGRKYILDSVYYDNRMQNAAVKK